MLTTTLVGWPSATSSAWLGPYKTPIRASGARGSTSRKTPLVVSSVPFSMPLATETMASGSAARRLSCVATLRSDWLGTANSHTWAPEAA